jgi:hypothetical protein
LFERSFRSRTSSLSFRKTRCTNPFERFDSEGNFEVQQCRILYAVLFFFHCDFDKAGVPIRSNDFDSEDNFEVQQCIMLMSIPNFPKPSFSSNSAIQSQLYRSSISSYSSNKCTKEDRLRWSRESRKPLATIPKEASTYCSII